MSPLTATRLAEIRRVNLTNTQRDFLVAIATTHTLYQDTSVQAAQKHCYLKDRITGKVTVKDAVLLRALLSHGFVTALPEPPQVIVWYGRLRTRDLTLTDDAYIWLCDRFPDTYFGSDAMNRRPLVRTFGHLVTNDKICVLHGEHAGKKGTVTQSFHDAVPDTNPYGHTIYSWKIGITFDGETEPVFFDQLDDEVILYAPPA